MATIKYLVECPPYEKRGVIRHNKSIELEVDIASLSDADAALLGDLAVSVFGKTTLILKLYEYVEPASGAFNQAGMVKETLYIAEHELTERDVFDLLPDLVDQKERAHNRLRVARQLADEQAAIKRILDKERQEREALAKQEAQQKRLEAAATFDWHAGACITNLEERLFIVAGLDTDSRFSRWAKKVIGIDRAKRGGYMFEGYFVESGTIELENAPAVYLVGAGTGSRKNNRMEYRVVMLNQAGRLEKTAIEANNTDSGWALVVRNQIERLLAGLYEPAVEPDELEESVREVWFNECRDLLTALTLITPHNIYMQDIVTRAAKLLKELGD